MAGIFGGRNEKAVFVKKGEAPPPIEQTKGIADGTFEEMKKKKKESRTEQCRAGSAEQSRSGSRAVHEKIAKLRIATFIFHWKLFPSCDTVRLKYKTKNNNINL